MTPPSLNGAVKPSNPFGYRDSSADIANALAQAGCDVLTPAPNPRPDVDADWTYPETLEGIARAIADGAEILWANTSLFDEHPMANFGFRDGLYVVGQPLDVLALLRRTALHFVEIGIGSNIHRFQLHRTTR